MTNAHGLPPTEDIPEADLVEQRIPVEVPDDEELDVARLQNTRDADADPADLIDQAISVPMPGDDYETEQ